MAGVQILLPAISILCLLQFLARIKYFHSKGRISLLWLSQITVVKVVGYLQGQLVLLFQSSEECIGISGSLEAAALRNSAWYLASILILVTLPSCPRGSSLVLGWGALSMNLARCEKLRGGPVSHMPGSQSRKIGFAAW